MVGHEGPPQSPPQRSEGSAIDSTIEKREECLQIPPRSPCTSPLLRARTPPPQESSSTPRPSSEYLHINVESTDVEAGVSDDTTTNDESEAKDAPARYALGNLGISLAAVFIVVPLLLFIALPSWFIITGQRHQMEKYFYLVYCCCVGLANGAYLGLLCDQIWQRKRVRDASITSLKWTWIVLAWMIGAGFGFRILYHICFGIAYLIVAAWDFIWEIAVAIWDGKVVHEATKASQ